MAAGYVSRLKKSCDLLIVTVSDQKRAHLVGKRLSQIMNALNDMNELMIAIAAKESKGEITDFRFKKSVETFNAFFLTQLTELIRGTKTNFMVFFPEGR